MDSKLKLVYIPFKNSYCIPHPHYDLCTIPKKKDQSDCYNVACILTDKDGAKLIRKWIKKHNKGIK